MERLEIYTFGGVSIRRGPEIISGFNTRKVAALLIYLAATQRPHPREVLADMLWEDRSQTLCLGNLRVALTNLRQILGPYLTITRDMVGLNLEADWWLDAVEIERALSDTRRSPDTLENALNLYRGDFLEGFYIESLAFDDWLRFERNRLQILTLHALDTLIEHYLSTGNFTAGISRCTQLIRMDSLREKTHQQMMVLLTLSGQREAALAQFETCRRLLQEELGVAPMVETTDLYERILCRQLVRTQPLAAVLDTEHPAAHVLSGHNLPVQATSFIGREHEVALVIDRLHSPDCRLLTLVGAGGMGKTRLALAVASQLADEFSDGVFFVPLAPLDTPEDLVPTIARALRLQFQIRTQPEEQQLLNYLRGKKLLLILDNFEHLRNGGPPFVDAILSQAPGVTILATSREPLGLEWEWLFDVRGLTCPTSLYADPVDGYEAIQLFSERARRVLPEFKLVQERAHVIRICQSVEGMPLGIEIAAAWVRMMPCSKIAAALMELEQPQQDIPARHRSLQALFDQTWQRLAPREQAAFAKLSVLRGSFETEAAEAIASVSFPTLAALVNKSLINCDPQTGRFSIHELLRQYGAARLCEDPQLCEDTFHRHSSYYLRLLAREPILGPRQLELLDDIGRETANIYPAWMWAIDHGRYEELEAGLENIFYYHGIRFLVREGAHLWFSLLDALEADEAAGPYVRLRARVMMYSGFAAAGRPSIGPEEVRERHEAALDLMRRYVGPCREFARGLASAWMFAGDPRGERCNEALAIARTLGHPHTLAYCLNDCASYHLFSGNLAIAEAYITECLQLGFEIKDYWIHAVCHSRLGRFEHDKQHFAEAIHHFRESNRWHVRIGNKLFAAAELIKLASVLAAGGHYGEAEGHIHGAAALFQELGYDEGEAEVSFALCMLNYEQRNYVQACHHIEESFSLIKQHSPYSKDHSEREIPLHFRGVYAIIAVVSGEIEQARQQLHEGLRLFLMDNLQLPLEVQHILFGAALLFHTLGQHVQALEIFALILPGAIDHAFRFDEDRLQADLEAEFGPEAIANRIEQEQTRDLHQSLANLLQALELPVGSMPPEPVLPKNLIHRENQNGSLV